MESHLKGNHFKLFASCIMIKGHKRGIIYDLIRSTFDFIPLGIFELFKEKRTIGELLDSYNNSEREIIEEYLDFLLEKEYIFFCDSQDFENFKELDLIWDDPAQITNAIVDITKLNNTNIYDVFNYLSLLGCRNISVWDNSNRTFKELVALFDKLKGISFKNFELIKKKTKEFESMDKEFIARNNICFSRFVVHGSDKNIEERFPNYFVYKESTLELDINRKDNLKSEGQFHVNLPLFMEAQGHNSYFNRKIYIDINGQIKNAPECEKSYGNINELKDLKELKQIIFSGDFQKYWFVSKDICTVCKDCEFRYMCVDNRIPFKRKNEEWYYKNECNYNPYIGKWKGDESYESLLNSGIRLAEKVITSYSEK